MWDDEPNLQWQQRTMTGNGTSGCGGGRSIDHKLNSESNK